MLSLIVTASLHAVPEADNVEAGQFSNVAPIASFTKPIWACSGVLSYSSSSTCGSATAINGANGCYVYYNFTPTAVGLQGATFTVSDTFGQSVQYNVYGTGVAPTLSIGAASSATCGTVTLGGSAVNCGYFYLSSNDPLWLYSISSNNSAFSYSASSSCIFSTGGGTTINGANGCYVYWTYTPTADGAQSATFTVTSDYGTTTTYAVSGTGEQVSVGATYNACGTVQVGTTSVDCGYIFVTTTGAGATLSTPYATSSDPTDFPIDTANSSCTNGAAVSGSNSCYFRFSFSPQSAAALNSTFTINTNYGSPTVNMTGTGVSVSVGTTSNTCGSVGVGSSSVDCGYIYVTTTGAGATLSTPYATSSNAQFPIDTANSSCTNGGAVSGTNSCYIRFSFNPTAIGSQSSTFTINTNYGSPTVVESATGAYGTASASGGTACGSVGAGAGSVSCGATTITAVGGPLTFGATPSPYTTHPRIHIGWSGCLRWLCGNIGNLNRTHARVH